MTQNAERPPLSVARTWLGLVRCFPGLYSLTAVLRITVFVGILQVTGLVIRFFFDSLTGSAPLAWGRTPGLRCCWPWPFCETA